MKPIVPLNDEQREFAERHHNLIGRFLRQNRLNPELFYDIAAFGYLEAARSYLEREELRERYPFEAVCITRMRDAVSRHFRREYARKRSAKVLSLDKEISENLELLDRIGVNDEGYSAVIARDLFDRLTPALLPAQAQVLRLRADGYSCSDIAEQLHITLKRVYSLNYRARARIPTRCAL